jgi:hypothetical protein
MNNPILLKDKDGNTQTMLDLRTLDDAELARLQTLLVAERRQRSRAIRTTPGRPLEDVLRHFSIA